MKIFSDMIDKKYIDFVKNRLMSYSEYAIKENISNTTVHNWAKAGIIDIVITDEDEERGIKGHKFVILKDDENKKEKYIKRVRKYKD